MGYAQRTNERNVRNLPKDRREKVQEQTYTKSLEAQRTEEFERMMQAARERLVPKVRVRVREKRSFKPVVYRKAKRAL